jgi:type IV pilus assembly protein PilW
MNISFQMINLPRDGSCRRVLPAERGMSLVELMVGIAVAMISILVVMSTVITAQQQNKTTIGGSDAQTSGTVASYMIERELRMAGSGLNFPFSVTLNSDAFCEIHAHFAGDDFTLSMIPVGITSQADGSDAITVFYGGTSSGSGLPNSSLASTYDNSAGVSPTFPLNSNGIGFGPGELFLVAPVVDGANQIGDDRPDCFLGENTAAVDTSPLTTSGTYLLPRVSGDQQIPQFDRRNVSGLPDGGLPLATTGVFVGQPLRFNGGAIGVSDIVFNLGGRPEADAQNRLTCAMGDCAVNKTYAISGGRLTITENLLPPALRTAWEVADNIVMLRAQYGKDTDDDGVVDAWDASLNAGGPMALWSEWNQVRAVRMAVVARSKTRDPAVVTPATVALWPGTNWTLPDMEARHYRYRTYQTIVPVRNNLWRPE